jgi:hypothetical protein
MQRQEGVSMGGYSRDDIEKRWIGRYVVIEYDLGRYIVMEYDVGVFADRSNEGVSYTKSRLYLTYACF